MTIDPKALARLAQAIAGPDGVVTAQDVTRYYEDIPKRATYAKNPALIGPDGKVVNAGRDVNAGFRAVMNYHNPNRSLAQYNAHDAKAQDELFMEAYREYGATNIVAQLQRAYASSRHHSQPNQALANTDNHAQEGSSAMPKNKQQQREKLRQAEINQMMLELGVTANGHIDRGTLDHIVNEMNARNKAHVTPEGLVVRSGSARIPDQDMNLYRALKQAGGWHNFPEQGMAVADFFQNYTHLDRAPVHAQESTAVAANAKQKAAAPEKAGGVDKTAAHEVTATDHNAVKEPTKKEILGSVAVHHEKIAKGHTKNVSPAGVAAGKNNALTVEDGNTTAIAVDMSKKGPVNDKAPVVQVEGNAKDVQVKVQNGSKNHYSYAVNHATQSVELYQQKPAAPATKGHTSKAPAPELVLNVEFSQPIGGYGADVVVTGKKGEKAVPMAPAYEAKVLEEGYGAGVASKKYAEAYPEIERESKRMATEAAAMDGLLTSLDSNKDGQIDRKEVEAYMKVKKLHEQYAGPTDKLTKELIDGNLDLKEKYSKKKDVEEDKERYREGVASFTEAGIAYQMKHNLAQGEEKEKIAAEYKAPQTGKELEVSSERMAQVKAQDALFQALLDRGDFNINKATGPLDVLDVKLHGAPNVHNSTASKDNGKGGGRGGA